VSVFQASAGARQFWACVLDWFFSAGLWHKCSFIWCVGLGLATLDGLNLGWHVYTSSGCSHSSKLMWACSTGDSRGLREQEVHQVCWSPGWELQLLHFCHILRASHRPVQNSWNEKQTPPHKGRRCEVTWQRTPGIRKGGELEQFCNLPSHKEKLSLCFFT
jgi:hypothetical protein